MATVLVLALIFFIDSFGKFPGKDFLIGFMGAVSAAAIFLYIPFWLLQPDIAIVPDFCRKEEEHTKKSTFVMQDGENSVLQEKEIKCKEPVYSFKIINLSRFHATDLSVELFRVRLTPVLQNGVIYKYDTSAKSLKLWRSEFKYVPKYDDNNMDADYAILIKSTDSIIEEVINERGGENDHPRHYLRLQVSIRHSFSDISKTFRLDYDRNKFKDNHKFVFGNTLKTEPFA